MIHRFYKSKTEENKKKLRKNKEKCKYQDEAEGTGSVFQQAGLNTHTLKNLL